MWQNMLHPSINKSKWTTVEDNKLRELTMSKQPRDWDLIAAKLNTQRTAFQCFHRCPCSFEGYLHETRILCHVTQSV
jgi:hypothetical protein